MPDIYFSGYGHRHISGSLNFILKKIPDFFGQVILIYECMHMICHLYSGGIAVHQCRWKEASPSPQPGLELLYSDG